MAKKLLYDMSRRLDSGKWEVVGKAYQDEETGRITMWIDPGKMKPILKNKSEGVPFILFPKDAPAAKEPPRHHTAPKPKPYDQTQAPEPLPKASDNWPPDFDDDIPF